MTVIVGIVSKDNLQLPEFVPENYLKIFKNNREESCISDCPICLDLILKKDTSFIAFLHCGHFMHLSCYNAGKLKSCPLCRAEIEIKLKINILFLFNKCLISETEDNLIINLINFYDNIDDSIYELETCSLEQLSYFYGWFNYSDPEISYLSMLLFSRMFEYNFNVDLLLPFFNYIRIISVLEYYLNKENYGKSCEILIFLEIFMKLSTNNFDKRFEFFRKVKKNILFVEKKLKKFKKLYKLHCIDFLNSKINSIIEYINIDKKRQQLYFGIENIYNCYLKNDFLECYYSIIIIEDIIYKYPSIINTIKYPDDLFLLFFRNIDIDINCSRMILQIFYFLINNFENIFVNNQISIYEVLTFMENVIELDILCAETALKIFTSYFCYYYVYGYFHKLNVFSLLERITALYNKINDENNFEIINFIIGEIIAQ